MKHVISIMTAVVVFICLSTAPAHADRKTREGFLLGVGAAVLGTAIYQGLKQPSGYREPRRYHVPPGYERGSQCRDTHCCRIEPCLWHSRSRGVSACRISAPWC